MADNTSQLQDAARAAQASGGALRLIGGNSKQRRLPPASVHGSAQPLNISDHSGIAQYTPTELVITARAGTTIAEVNAALAEKNQMLPFEPPEDNGATVGGAIATAAAGGGGGYYGMTKDFILGAHIINGAGDALRFGGEVMKNVAGYDVSRLMTGALGTLGIILQASIKVLPVAQQTLTLRREMSAAEAYALLAQLQTQPHPLSAGCYDSAAGALHLRLSGGAAAVATARKQLGGEVTDDAIWTALRELRHPLFNNNDDNNDAGDNDSNNAGDIWQIKTILPPAAPPPAPHLLEWGVNVVLAEPIRSEGE